MDMPKPNEHHLKLHKLIGTWAGEETISPSDFGPGGAAKATFKARADLDGFFIIADYSEEKDGKRAFAGHSIFGWDDKEQVVVWWWFDIMGGIPPKPLRAPWQGDTLVFVNRGDEQGNSRFTYRFEGTDRYHLTIESSKDGETWKKSMEGDYKRVG